ncbi:hypothetical protein AYL99_07953 [Fonsecaea erecta]|uniref:Uncharacterized protein n=1 Tax=Fonsecaea erecta TaxID=1367422 RepID=A0A178ZDR9_9EURO|nr:hypothetical protein AYL99_07953 [Fonsecaea erecta]OAP57215.1 hypothetical protein AYL99_07953 [Fonsecaea erecta]
MYLTLVWNALGARAIRGGLNRVNSTVCNPTAHSPQPRIAFKTLAFVHFGPGIRTLDKS